MAAALSLSPEPAPVRLLEFVTDFRVGGTERQFVNLVRGLEPARFDLHLGCFRRTGRFGGELDGRLIPITAYEIRHLYAPGTLRRQVAFARYVRRHGIDVVRTYGYYPNVFGVPAARAAGAPVVIASIRDTGDHLSPLQRRIQREVCRLADCVLVNAEAVKSRLVSIGYDEETIAVIRNGVDMAPFDGPPDGAALRAELGLPAAAPLVTVLSRLNPLKGVEFFLEAVALLSRDFPEARFLIVGDSKHPDGGDSYRYQLEALAAQRGLSERVLFTGFRKDTAAILSETAISVLPSLTEGLSNTLLESMAAGAAVVATDVGGNPEVVDDGRTGLLVPPRDAGALAAAMAQLLTEPELARRMGRAGRQRIVEEFSLEVMVRSTGALYARLLERSRRRLPVPPPQSRTLVSSVVRAVEEGGPGQLVLRGMHHLATPAADFGSVTFFRRDLAAEPPPVVADVDVDVRPASLDDLDRLRQACDPGRPAEVLANRLRLGDLCFLALDRDGRPVHTDWVTSSRGYVPELDLDVVPRPGEAYLYDAYTPPEHRGRRLFGVVLDQMFQHLRAAGFLAAYSYVRGDSPLGLAGARRRLRPVGRLWYLRVRGGRTVVLGRRGPGMPELVRPAATAPAAAPRALPDLGAGK